MGPRQAHCVNSLISSQYIKDLSQDMDESNLKTYLMINGWENVDSSFASDFKKIQMRLKVRF
jgi:hypothetical protein